MTRVATPITPRPDAALPANVLEQGSSIVDPPNFNAGNGSSGSLPPSRGNRIVELCMKFGRRGFWPMADQGVVSIGNFLTAIFVARGLAKDEFGLFSVAFEFMLFLNSLQNAVVTYPLTVEGAVVDDEGLRRYTTASMIFTLILGVPVLLMTLLAALISSHLLPVTSPMGAVLSNAASGRLGLAANAVIALVLWQLQETTRRSLWAHFRHKQAILGDAVSYLGQALGIAVLWKLNAVTLGSIFGVMILSSLIAAILQAMQIGLRRVPMAEIPALAKQFWKVGRWVAVTNLSTLVMSVCGSWAMWFFHSVGEVAEFFALGQLMKLCNPIIASIGGLIMPAAAKSLKNEGMKSAVRATMQYAALGAAMLSPYLMFIMFAPTLTVKLFYGRQSHFLGHEFALRACVVGYYLIYVVSAASAFLNGIKRPRYSFYGQMVGSVAVVLIVLPLNIKFGLYGCIWGGVIQAILQLGVLLYYSRRAAREGLNESTITPPGFDVVPRPA